MQMHELLIRAQAVSENKKHIVHL